MKKIARVIGIVLPITAIILVVLQVVISNELAMLGKRLGQLDTQVSRETDLNEALSTEVASASSLLVLRERAQKLGFIEPTAKQIMSLTLEVPVALNRPDSLRQVSLE